MKPLSTTENSWIADFLGNNGWLMAWKKMRDNHMRETSYHINGMNVEDYINERHKKDMAFAFCSMIVLFLFGFMLGVLYVSK